MSDAAPLTSVGEWTSSVLSQVRGYKPKALLSEESVRLIKPEVIINNEWSEKS